LNEKSLQHSCSQSIGYTNSLNGSAFGEDKQVTQDSVARINISLNSPIGDTSLCYVLPKLKETVFAYSNCLTEKPHYQFHKSNSMKLALNENEEGDNLSLE